MENEEPLAYHIIATRGDSVIDTYVSAKNKRAAMRMLTSEMYKVVAEPVDTLPEGVEFK